METKLGRRLWAVLVLLAEQEGQTVDAMAGVLLSEAVRQSLQGNIAFPVFRIPEPEKELRK